MKLVNRKGGTKKDSLLHNFSLATLRKIARAYNLHYTIRGYTKLNKDELRGYTKLNKDELIEALNKYIYIDNDLKVIHNKELPNFEFNTENLQLKKVLTESKPRKQKNELKEHLTEIKNPVILTKQEKEEIKELKEEIKEEIKEEMTTKELKNLVNEIVKTPEFKKEVKELEKKDKKATKQSIKKKVVEKVVEKIIDETANQQAHKMEAINKINEEEELTKEEKKEIIKTLASPDNEETIETIKKLMYETYYRTIKHQSEIVKQRKFIDTSENEINQLLIQEVKKLGNIKKKEERKVKERIREAYFKEHEDYKKVYNYILNEIDEVHVLRETIQNMAISITENFNFNALSDAENRRAQDDFTKEERLNKEKREEQEEQEMKKNEKENKELEKATKQSKKKKVEKNEEKEIKEIKENAPEFEKEIITPKLIEEVGTIMDAPEIFTKGKYSYDQNFFDMLFNIYKPRVRQSKEQLQYIKDIQDIQQSYDLYNTPIECVKEILKDMDEYIDNNNVLQILEPSAGMGNLIRPIIDYINERKLKVKNFDAVEITELLSSILSEKTKLSNVYMNDFLEFKPTKNYNLIIMNPPYKAPINNKLEPKAYLFHLIKAMMLPTHNEKIIYAIVPHLGVPQNYKKGEHVDIILDKAMKKRVNEYFNFDFDDDLPVYRAEFLHNCEGFMKFEYGKPKQLGLKVGLFRIMVKEQNGINHIEGGKYKRQKCGKGDLLGTLKKGVSAVKSFFTPNFNDYNNKSKKTLKDYGNDEILSLAIYRTPINSAIEKVLNILSLGKFSKAKSEQYDALFHLSLEATVKHGNVTKRVFIEKNQSINISGSYSTNKGTEIMPVPLKKSLTLGELIGNTEMNVPKEKYFKYTAFEDNCQQYIKWILESNGLYNKQIDSFLFQPLGKIIEKIPSYVPKVANIITDVANVAEKTLGLGRHRNERLQAIVIKKPTNLREVEELAKHITKSTKKHLIRETGKSYRVRIVPKEHLKNFRTKVVNKHISLVFGQLK